MSTRPAPEIDLIMLRRLTAGRWLMPILAELGRDRTARFGVLVRRLGISRSVLAASLDTLEEEGWIARNPGHGHPLRPEYLLSAGGRSAARRSVAVLSFLAPEQLHPGDLGRWGLATVAVMARGSERFSDLATALAPITPRALTMALDQLIARGLAVRYSEPARHPRYALTALGHRLAAGLESSL